MSTISLPGASNSDPRFESDLAGMDSSGYLLPEMKPKLKELIQTSDPLLGADPVLLSLIDHYLELPGIGSGELLSSYLTNIANTYAAFKDKLIKLTSGVLPTNLEDTTLNEIVENLHRYELAHRLASNGTLDTNRYKAILHYFDERSDSVALGVDQILDKIAVEEGSSNVIAALQDLKDLPRRLSKCRALDFTADQSTTLEVGDIVSLDRIGRAAILELLDNGAVRCLAYNTSQASYEEKIFNLKSCTLVGSTITRGQSFLSIAGEEPFSERQPFKPGVHVTRPPKRFSSELFEFGEVIAYESSSSYKILWRYDKGGVGIEINNQDQLRVVETWPHQERSYATFLEKAVYGKWGTPISRALGDKSIEKATFNESVRQGEDIEALCRKVLASKYPLALHVIDEQIHHLSRSGNIDKILGDVAVSNKVEKNHPRGSPFRDLLASIPEDEATYLENHGCMPVLLVLGSSGDPNLLKHIIKMQQNGWRVIICRDKSYALEDQYLNGAITDIESFGLSEDFTIIDYYDGQENRLEQFINLLGVRAGDLLDQEIEQYDSIMNVQAEHFAILTRWVDLLAEQNPSRPINKLNYELAKLQQELEGTPSEISFNNELANLPVLSGETSSKSRWSFRELVEISSALAKSRLEVNHPAVAIRGITCFDLSPAALSKLIQQGAKIFRIADSNDISSAIAITFSPSVTDEIRPGLSDSLGYPASTGYVYWIWVDPESRDDVRAPYVKLINRIILEQLADGATYLFGRVLEKNTPSMRAARGIAGFELVPLIVNLQGEPAIGVGLKLSRQNVEGENTQDTIHPRIVMQESYNILVNGFDDNLGDSSLTLQRQERVSQVKDFLETAITFKKSCEELFKYADYFVRWSVRDKLIESVEMKLSLMRPYISYQSYKHLEETLLACTKDDQFLFKIGIFKELLQEVIPESSRALSLQLRQLNISASDQIAIDNRDLLIGVEESIEVSYRGAEMPVPPTIDIGQVYLRAKTLPDNIMRILDSWWNRLGAKFVWVDDNHTNIFECHRQLRQWIESDIKNKDSFCSTIGISDDFNDLSEQVQQHISQFNELILWVNQVARLDYYDHTVGNYIWPIIHAFLGRRVS